MSQSSRHSVDHDPTSDGDPANGRALIDALLGRAVARRPLRSLPGHGLSGASLEAVVLDDGTQLVVKRFSPATDLLMRVTHDRGRAGSLWATGIFDRMPPEVDHATIAAAPEDDGWVLVLRDVGDALLLAGDRVLTREECRRCLAALAQMHAAFAGAHIPGLCTVVDLISAMTPSVMEPWCGDPSGLPEWTLRGWAAFFDLAPRDVAAAVAAVHARPDALARELECAELTLVHGDLAPGNMGLTPTRVVLLDWALATHGPAALDYAAFLAAFRSRLAPEPDQLVDDIRAAAGERHDERAFQLAVLATFANYGWLNADRAVHHPDAVRREREHALLAWWVERVRHALASTWSPA